MAYYTGIQNTPKHVFMSVKTFHTAE